MAKRKFAIDKAVVMDEMQEKTKAVIPEEKPDSGKKLKKRDTHKVYSFWANKEQIEIWKCYQEASNELQKAEDLGLKAIQEYIENHPLQGIEADMYELKLKAKGLEGSIYR